MWKIKEKIAGIINSYLSFTSTSWQIIMLEQQHLAHLLEEKWVQKRESSAIPKRIESFEQLPLLCISLNSLLTHEVFGYFTLPTVKRKINLNIFYLNGMKFLRSCDLILISSKLSFKQKWVNKIIYDYTVIDEWYFMEKYLFILQWYKHILCRG